MHAKSRLAVLATILVALLTASCEWNQIVYDDDDDTPVGRVDTVGNCVRMTTIYIGTTPVENGAARSITVSSRETPRVVESQSPSGCGTPRTFSWIASSSVVSVTRQTSNSAEVLGVSAGTSVVTAVSEEDSNVRLSLNYTVTGGTGSVSSITYTPSGGTLTTASPTRTLTAQCTQGDDIATACSPSWYSTNPNAISVDVGPSGTAVITRRNPGTADICVKWSPTRTTPYRCFSWTAQ